MLFLCIFAIFGVSLAAPGYYFHGPPAYDTFRWYNHEPLQRQMSYQYQPQWMHQMYSSADGGVSAFVAGNSGSTGTVYESPPILNEATEGNAEESFAEAEVSTEVPIVEIPTRVAKTAAPKRIPKRPIQVLPQSNEDDEYEDIRRQSPSSGQMYFPLRFGSTNGAAIAIANSYSPGKGGTAVSHATAYGNPGMEMRKRPQQPQQIDYQKK